MAFRHHAELGRIVADLSRGRWRRLKNFSSSMLQNTTVERIKVTSKSLELSARVPKTRCKKGT